MDDSLFEALNRGAANPTLDWLMPRITNLHHQAWFFALVALACVVALRRGGPRARLWVLAALLSVGLSDLASSRIAKPLIPRERPCHRRQLARQAPAPMSYPGTRLAPGTECPGSRSFPSNHAANMAALGAVGWWFTRRRARWLWLLLPLVIGYSRIYLGFHYPSDVLGGWALGAAVAALILRAARARLERGRAEESAPSA